MDTRTALNRYIEDHTEIVPRDEEDPFAIDMQHCKVRIKGTPDKADLQTLVDAFETNAKKNPLRSGTEQPFFNISSWLGSTQNFAIQFMALASVLGLADLNVPSVTAPLKSHLSITARPQPANAPVVEESPKIIRPPLEMFTHPR